MSIDMLPMEICAEIVSNICLKGDLSSLSLVSSRWLPLAQRRLFSRITVLNSHPARNFSTFRTFLARSPAIRAVIRRLKLVGSRRDQANAPMSMDDVDWILRNCPLLEDLTFHSTSLESTPLSAVLPRGAHRLKSLTLSHMTDSLDSVNSLIVFLSTFSCIDRLCFDNNTHGTTSTTDDDEPFGENELLRACASIDHLRVFELTACSDDMCEILSRSNVPLHLTKYTLDFSNCTDLFGGLPSPALTLLQRAAPTLEHLDLHMFRVGHFDHTLYQTSHEYIHDVLRPIIFQLTHLRSFSLTLMLFNRPGPQAMTTFWDIIMTTLSIFPPGVQRVEFIAWDGPLASGSWDRPARPWLTEGMNFAALQGALMRFTELESVSFRSWEQVSDEEQEVISRGMPELARKGAIQYAPGLETKHIVQGLSDVTQGILRLLDHLLGI